jgi:transcriptional regulator of acetoin/glycerol metabolism
LENVIEYAVVRTKNKQIITKESLPSSINNIPAVSGVNPKEFKKESAADLVRHLEKNHWNKTKVAEELGIGRTTLWRMLKDLPKNS